MIDGGWSEARNRLGAEAPVAGCVTFYSRRRRARPGTELVPQVGPTTEPKLFGLLARYAGRADCGPEPDGVGPFRVYARSVTDLHEPATLMLAGRAGFDLVPRPPWHEPATEVPEGEDVEWDDKIDQGNRSRLAER